MNTETGMSAMQHKRATAIYLHALAQGHKPAADELGQLCTAIHAAIVDEPIMLWLDRSFEEMSDSVYRARECARVSASQMEYYTSREQMRVLERQGNAS